MGTSGGRGVQLGQMPLLRQEASAALVAYASVLSLSATGVDRWLQEQLARQPALEVPAPRTCARCAATVWRPASHRCSTVPARFESDLTDGSDDGEVAVALASVSRLGPDARRVAEHLLADLDERGRLDRSCPELAAALGVTHQLVRAVLDDLRTSLGPGLGARDLRESLLLQLAVRPEAPSLCRSLLARQWESLAAGRVDQAAADEGVAVEQVHEVLQWIATHLDPGRRPGRRTNRARAVAPDLVVRAVPDGLVVDAPDGPDQAARVCPAYQRLALRPEDRAAVAAAEAVVALLAARTGTLLRVAQTVVDRQAPLLLGRGPHHPVTRAAVADELRLHESTVSRAVSGKVLLLPDGRTTPLAELFGPPGRSAREALRQLLAELRPQPSDGELARRLTEAGHPTARRTVAKYRAQLHVPAARA